MLGDTPNRTSTHAGPVPGFALGAVDRAAKELDVVACEFVHVETKIPTGDHDTAKSNGCDLVVMASHGRRGIAAIVLGSETVKVHTTAKNPCLSIDE